MSERHRKQYDVYPNPDPVSAEAHPYLIDLQSDQIAHLNTRIVAPLVEPRHMPLFEALVPVVTVSGTKYVIDVVNMSVVRTHILVAPVANLERESCRISRALDMVFYGI